MVRLGLSEIRVSADRLEGRIVDPALLGEELPTELLLAKLS